MKTLIIILSFLFSYEQSEQYLLCSKAGKATGHIVVNEQTKQLWIRFYDDAKNEQFVILYTQRQRPEAVVYHIQNSQARGNVFILMTRIEIDLLVGGKSHYNEKFLRCKTK